MKNQEEAKVSLSDDIKNQINKDIIAIKTSLKDDREFADKTIEKILTLNKEKVPPDFIRDHIGQRYLSLKDDMTVQTYNKFINLQDAVNDLVDLVTLQHKLTEDKIILQHLIIRSDLEANNPEYKFKFVLTEEEILEDSNLQKVNNLIDTNLQSYEQGLSVQITCEIETIYKLSLDEDATTIGGAADNTGVYDL